MASLGMGGTSYSLTNSEINSEVTRTSEGNYALGYIDGGSFYVNYVGRADNDLAKRLKEHTGDYSRFKYRYATSPKDAFEKECENYHDFGENKKLDNDQHPERPDGTSWKCPGCGRY